MGGVMGRGDELTGHRQHACGTQLQENQAIPLYPSTSGVNSGGSTLNSAVSNADWSSSMQEARSVAVRSIELASSQTFSY